jgi:hypothetical protein
VKKGYFLAAASAFFSAVSAFLSAFFSATAAFVSAFFSAVAAGVAGVAGAWAAAIPDTATKKTNAIVHTIKRFILLPPLFIFCQSPSDSPTVGDLGNLLGITFINEMKG